MRLTDVFIRNLRFEGKKVAHFDDAVPNFGVRVYKSHISFIVMQGRDRKLVTLGRYPEMSLKEARTAAMLLLSDTRPQKPKKAVSEALEAFFAHCEVKNRPRTVRDYRRLLKPFPSGEIASVGRIQLLDAISRFNHVPAEKSHVTTAFQVFLNWCVHNGYIDQNPIAGLRNQGRIQQRERVLTDDELRTLWHSLGDDDFSDIVRILILTGLRRGEVAHIVVNGDTLTIPAEHTKNKREHTVPIGAIAQQYVRPIQFNGWGKSKARLDKVSGVSNYTLHDLRRTYATTMAKLGTPIHVTEKLINHVSGSLAGVTGIYNRHSYFAEMRDACHRYETWLSSLVSEGLLSPELRKVTGE